MGGFAGQILWVDLGSGTIESRPLEPTFARRYMGGLGFGTRLYLDVIKERTEFEALSAGNPIVIMTGPLTGIKLHAVARWTIGSKSPLTGFWGEANVGGYFGAHLKFAGYDGIVLTGAAARPTYLSIDDGQIELCDAAAYWGLDIYDATDALTEDRQGDSRRRGEVLTIGPAGENLVRFATVTNHKGHTAGRTGLGAVWGAKKLKAIFVRGQNKLDVAHPERLKELRQELNALHAGNIAIETLREVGTPGHWDVGLLTGDIPIKNWQQSDWELMDEVGPTAYAERMLTGHKTCYACGVACKREAKVDRDPFRFERGPGPEYETLASFGPLCLNSNLDSIGKANELCNRYGMDTISCGATIAFAMDCFENELIGVGETDGLELTWGNAAAIVALTDKIGRQEGVGALLARGSAYAAGVWGTVQWTC